MSRHDYLKHLGIHQTTPIAMSHIRCNCNTPNYNPIGRCLSCGGFHEGDTANAPDNAPSIDDMNEAIAIFDGWEKRVDEKDNNAESFVKNGRHNYHYQLQYHTSWDALMPVVEKIESLENKRFGVCIDVLDTMIMDYKVGHDQGEKIVIQTDIYPDNGDTKLSITHDAVYQFIQWYNHQQQHNDTTSHTS